MENTTILIDTSIIIDFIRKKANRLIEFRDIFIAATSIISGMPIATLNVKHFMHIPEISIIPEIQ